MKFHIYIRDPEKFAEGEYFLGVGVCPESMREYFVEREGRQLIAEIDIDVDAFHDDCVPAAVADLDRQIKETRVKAETLINELENRKQNLLAITHEI